KLRAEFQQTETELSTARAELDGAREAMQIRQRERSRLQAEIDTLQSIVDAYAQGDFTPVLESIRADEGFETALSKALGDTLMASLEDGAPVVWKTRTVTN